ncbi:hypothetical protein SAMN05216229_1296 [Geopseudomonas sagittaria]|uniref:Collagenase NC10 and Endostatin n=1 Tax=Geopseudomonas sagittaria TaxID=1135990 RepID=A0A1I5Z5X6_9GAMM|nr:hypothetical protein [Pseudomonas sagittaria]SFQ51872.1 hypothetical protein SAMN05216229_1296 [Pseudomonas sagittaria]
MFPIHFDRRVALAALVLSCSVAAQAEMSFFVTSVGMGKGADLGGLVGADAHCQKLAEAAGAGGHTWRAYLSTSAANGQPAVHARERIGKGPWQNAKGVVVASDVAQLHGDNNLNRETALDERGMPVKGRGEKPNMHDILTGSQADGTAFAGDEDRTCGNWTSSTSGAAMVGHHDRMGLDDSAAARSWNTSHLSRGGCSNEALASSGGAGLLYCFAAD